MAKHHSLFSYKFAYLFQTSRTLLHRVHKKCVALHPQTSHLSLMPCDTVNTYHQWTFKELQPKY